MRMRPIALWRGVAVTPGLALAAHADAGYNVTVLQGPGGLGDSGPSENIMRQALNIKDFVTPDRLPGASINTSPTNYFPIRQLHLARFSGEHWEPFGDLISD